ncbi:hypothetical protein Q9S36_36675 [Microbacterium sp. ARD31]|uniref:lipopolysaccharide biosynthesis protein n=1 Tax=Microbacterium sp. ARD31 TaxID=2962576 RepID=UPI002881A062|nr:hypothetical protein [Microbacterium sp. ARD31]MDT0185737.1 hypothetical protein [Microbacterium sp. ARD31]
MSLSFRNRMLVLLASRAAAAIAQAVTLVLVARGSSVEAFGVLIAWSGIFLVVAGVADLGLSGFILVQFAKGDHGAVRTAVQTNRASAALAAALLATATLLWAPPAAQLALVALAIAFAMEKNTDTCLNVAVAGGRVGASALSLLVRRCGALATVATLSFVGNLDSIAVYGVAYLLWACVAQAHLTYILPSFGITKGPAAPVLPVLRASSRYMAQFVAGQSRSLDTAIVGLIAGPAVAGLYGAANRLSAPVLLVPGAIASVLTPHSAARSGAEARRAVRRVLISMVLALAVVVVLAPFAPAAIVALLGENFADAAAPFIFTVAAMVFVGFTVPIAGVLQGQGRQTFVAWVSLGGGAATLLAVGIGAWVAAAEGAATGLLIASMVTLCVHATVGLKLGGAVDGAL